MAEKNERAQALAEVPLAQVRFLWNKLDLVDRRIFLTQVLGGPLRTAMTECGGDLDAALDWVAVRG